MSGIHYRRLKREQSELRSRLNEVDRKLAAQFGEKELERLARQITQLLSQLDETGREPESVTIRVHERLSDWLRSRMRATGENAETYFNGLLLEDYLQRGMECELGESIESQPGTSFNREAL